ncbi:hypothetical protein FIM12_06795 [SAR202 cluster bacterium AD-804-J14_MRT_500m]|nr:hypothetical protein [SAR202 cluster bacterium AD-804-J14_MRT_500m]
MAYIPDQNKAEIKRRLRKELREDVTLNFFTAMSSTLLTIPGRECPTCPQNQKLLEELTSLSPKLHFKIYDFYSDQEIRDEYAVERIPATVLETEGSERLRYYGIPAGYEFATLLEDLITLSRGVSPLQTSTRRNLRKINQPIHMQVFVTPS